MTNLCQPQFYQVILYTLGEYKEYCKDFLKSIFLGSLFIAISAQLSVNFGLIPFTLQTSAIFLVVYKLGISRGTAAVLLYLLEGAAGAPVFQNFSGGILAFAGPTGGYLFGFVPMAYVFGYILKIFKNSKISLDHLFLLLVFAEAIAAIVDYVFGYTQLLAFVSPETAFKVGILPFLFTGMMKIILTAMFIKGSHSIQH